MAVDRLYSVNGLDFQYGDGTEVFRDLHLSVERGEFLGLLAENGGGKSTLLMLLCGLLNPDGGEVLLEGKPLSEYEDRDLYREVGYVFQNPDDQLFGATLFEDLAFGPRNQGLEEDVVERRVRGALSDVELDLPLDRPIHRLSFGQRKRASLAGILAMGVDVLLLDEPTAELDPVSQQNIFRLLKRLNREKNKTVVMASHHIDLFGAADEQIAVIGSPENLEKNVPREIFTDDELLNKASLRKPLVLSLAENLLEKGWLRPPEGMDRFDFLVHLLESGWGQRQPDRAGETTGPATT